ncbi:DgyrCDS8014 [Dimorphilus gyrociliatus]|uniref:DgyrCDS8014 n=1 Tax=Dimorphilus gyrociliatus TaxID=2664684 RepID=A0A7I8VTY3_9ANNE|nr:DgyrCDS8014 [Dimorphilus gyrociliatus]
MSQDAELPSDKTSEKQVAVYIMKLLIRNIALEKKLYSLNSDGILEDITPNEALTYLPDSIKPYLIHYLFEENGQEKKPKPRDEREMTGLELEAAECLTTLLTSRINDQNRQQLQTKIKTETNNTETILSVPKPSTSSVKSREGTSDGGEENENMQRKYLDRRAKNNFAARKCREKKRMENAKRQQQNSNLAYENAKLKAELQVLEDEYESLKDLIQKKRLAKERGEEFHLPPPIAEQYSEWKKQNEEINMGKSKESIASSDNSAYDSSDEDGKLVVDTS